MAYADDLRTHTENYFGSRANAVCWDSDFSERHAPGLKCFEFQPGHEFPFVTYVSCGLASIPTDQDARHEYVISSPFRTLEHAELMNMIAAAILQREKSFCVGEVVPVGRPWVFGAEAEHLLISLPYPFGPKLELAEAVLPNLRLLWLLPIHASEVGFMKSHGLEALEQAFDRHGIKFWDANREPVV